MDAYEELRHLGHGAFGEVKLARSKVDGTLHAVKRVPYGDMSLRDREGHVAEVQALQKLQHPCILRYYGSILEGDHFNLITEFADAGDLQQLLRCYEGMDRALEAMVIFALFAQLASAVSHVHDRKIMHRDLKPSNVLLTTEGLLKLGDFGVAKIVAGTTMCDQMTCVGSPTYMAPEVIGGEPYGPACDVWSLGVILYELCSFRKPFEGRSIAELVMRISSGAYKPLHDLETPPVTNGSSSQLNLNSSLHMVADPIVADLLIVDTSKRAKLKHVLGHPSLGLFATSIRSSMACVACAVQDKAKDASAKLQGSSASEASGTAAGTALNKREAPRLAASAVTRGSTVASDDTFALSMSLAGSTQTDAKAKSACDTFGWSQLLEETSEAGAMTLTAAPVTIAPHQDQHEEPSTSDLRLSQNSNYLRDLLGGALGSAHEATPRGTLKFDSDILHMTQGNGFEHSTVKTMVPTQGSFHRGDTISSSTLKTSSTGSNTQGVTIREQVSNHSSALSPPPLGASRSQGSRGSSSGASSDYLSPGVVDTSWNVHAGSIPMDLLTSGDFDPLKKVSKSGSNAPVENRSRKVGSAGGMRHGAPKPSSASRPTPSMVSMNTKAAPASHSPPSPLRMQVAAQSVLSGEMDKSVTWPANSPGHRSQHQHHGPHQYHRPDYSATTPPAGRPTTPESERVRRRELEKARSLRSAGGLTIPFFDGPASAPPKAFVQSLEMHDERQKQREASRSVGLGSAHSSSQKQQVGPSKMVSDLTRSSSRTRAREGNSDHGVPTIHAPPVGRNATANHASTSRSRSSTAINA